jgi:hypothetical protein
MSVAPLCWGKNEHQVFPASQYVAAAQKKKGSSESLPVSANSMKDVIIVCECVYAMEIVVPLVTEMERQTEPWLELDGACAPVGCGEQKARAKAKPFSGPVVLLAMEERDKAVYDRFWELVSHCFIFEKVPLSDVPAEFRTDYVELYIGRRKAGTEGGSGLKVRDEPCQEVSNALEPTVVKDAAHSMKVSKTKTKRRAAELNADEHGTTSKSHKKKKKSSSF